MGTCETVSKTCSFGKTVTVPERIVFSQSWLYEMCSQFIDLCSFVVKLVKVYETDKMRDFGSSFFHGVKVYKTDKMLYFIKPWLRTQFCLFLVEGLLWVAGGDLSPGVETYHNVACSY